MDVRVLNEAPEKVEADVLILPRFEGQALTGLGAAIGSEMAQATSSGDFTGQYGQTTLLYTGGRLAARKLLLLGLGKEPVTPYHVRRVASIAARAADQSGARRIAFLVPAIEQMTEGEVAQFLTEGALHGLHQFQSLKSKPSDRSGAQELLLIGGPGLERGAHRGRTLAEATNLARSVNWLPGNYLTATKLAEAAAQVAEQAGLEIELYDKEGCKQLGLGLLLAVNQGSTEEPRFIVMRYKGNGGNGPWLGLVGKGVTFDTGGISIKPSDNMWDMKYDMCGAGAVLGAMQAIARLRPPCDVMGIIAATDNMPDGSAFKPGDVITGLSGKTVEIRSTDAEGRLVLADGVAYAEQQGCKALITVATLTGATTAALGSIRYGMVANDDAWETEVFTAANEAGERGWRLPHDPEYNEVFASPIADMANLGRGAGVIIGGMFILGHLNATPCVHLDIAAAAWRNAADGSEAAGATGVGVKTLVRAAERFAAQGE